jgi:putative NADH-flavin reductase
MKIALIGATGMIGSRILEEALARGHHVTAIVRHPERVPVREGVVAVAADATDTAEVAGAVIGADIVIDAYSPGAGPQDDLSKNARAILDGLAQAEVGRAIVVGGAGSLEVGPNALLVDAPAFPAAAIPRATAQKGQLDIFRASTGSPVAWTFVSPAAKIAPGTRTGTFRIGGDQLLVDEHGVSQISAEDYAVAILNEAENPTALNRRITVAY